MSISATARGASNHNTSANSVAISPASNFGAGLAVLILSYDNSGGGGADPYSSISDSLGNTWTPRQNALNDPGSGSAGNATRIFTTDQAQGLLTTGTTITVSFGSNVTAKAWNLWQVTPDTGCVAKYETGNVGTAATASPSILSGSITIGELIIGAVGGEYGTTQTFTDDADTSNGSWSASQYTEIGSTTSGVFCGSQTKVVTATGTQTYNPTLGTSCDLCTAWIGITQVGILAGTSDGTSTTSGAVTGKGSLVSTAFEGTTPTMGGVLNGKGFLASTAFEGTSTFSGTLVPPANSLISGSFAGTSAIAITVYPVYEWRRAITIANAHVYEDNTNVEILVSLTQPYLKGTAYGGKVRSASGHDIGFFNDTAFREKLEWDIEKYDPTTGELKAWVKVPNVYDTSDVTFYLAYGQLFAVAQNTPQNVWTRYSGGVYHFNGDPPSIEDSSGSNYDLTNNDGIDPTTGIVAGGALFTAGGSQSFTRSGVNSTATQDFTCEIWFKCENSDPSTLNCILIYNGIPGTNGWGLVVVDGNIQIQVGSTLVSSTYDITKSTWIHAFMVRDGSNFRLFMDGGTSESAGPAALSVTTPTTSFQIGDVDFEGIIDEVRVDGWQSHLTIKTRYDNVAAPANFYSVGSEVGPNYIGVLYAAGTYAGVYTPTALLQGKGRLSGVSDGVATTQGVLRGWAYSIGSYAGTSTFTGLLSHDIAGTFDGVASLSGTLVGRGLVQGAFDGISDFTGDLTPTVPGLAGSFAGTATTQGSITGDGLLSGSVSGVSDASSQLLAKGQLSSAVAGISVFDGVISASALMSGAFLATSEFIGRVDTSLTGTSSGSSTFTGILTASGALQSSTSGTSQFDATLSADGRVVGAFSGIASFTGTALADGTLVSTYAGTSLLTASLSARAHVSGSFSSVATTQGLAYGKALGSASFSASATLSGSMVAVARIVGAWQGDSTFDLSVGPTRRIRGEFFGTSVTSADLIGLAKLRSVFAGFSLVDGSLSGRTSFIGSFSGSSSWILVNWRRHVSGSFSTTSAFLAGPRYKAYIEGGFESASDFLGALEADAELSGTFEGSSDFIALGDHFGVLRATWNGSTNLSGTLRKVIRISGTFNGIATIGSSTVWIAHTYGAWSGIATVSGEVGLVGKDAIHAREPLEYIFGSIRSHVESGSPIRSLVEETFDSGMKVS